MKADLQEIAEVEQTAQLEGRQMVMVLTPKRNLKKAGSVSHISEQL